MEQLKKTAQVLIDAKAEIEELLPEGNDLLRLYFSSALDKLINRALFLGGQDIQSAAQPEYGPITNFMGEEIHLAKEVKEEDLEPGEEDKQKFLVKVDTLLKDLPGLENKKIIESYVTKEDILVIRGVAKKVKLENYATGKIDGEFLDAIRAAKLALDAAKVFEQEENEKTK